MHKKIALLTAFISSFAVAQERIVEIQKFDEFKAPKGYVLSVDLHYTKMCSKIWTEQIKEFKKQNPSIKDPNIIAINQKIKVQDCRIEEDPVMAVEATPAPIDQKAVVKDQRKRNLFILLSAELNKASKGNDNESNEGAGVKLEIGKYFRLSDDRMVKASLGVLSNNTKMENSSEKHYQIVGTADASYLFKMSENLSLGPNLGFIGGNGFVNKENEKMLSAFAGVNLDYSLGEKFMLDLKVQNALESRSNIYTTFGIGFKF